MSKQSSLDKYFAKRKENDENASSTKKCRVEDENIITQSNTSAIQPEHLPVNHGSTSDIQSVDNYTITSKILTTNSLFTKNNSELRGPPFPGFRANGSVKIYENSRLDTSR